MLRQASGHDELAEPHERNINVLHRSPWACRRACPERAEGPVL